MPESLEQYLDEQLDSLKDQGLLRSFHEKVVLRSVRRKGKDSADAEEVTTMISKGGEVDVDL